MQLAGDDPDPPVHVQQRLGHVKFPSRVAAKGPHGNLSRDNLCWCRKEVSVMEKLCHKRQVLLKERKDSWPT